MIFTKSSSNIYKRNEKISCSFLSKAHRALQRFWSVFSETISLIANKIRVNFWGYYAKDFLFLSGICCIVFVVWLTDGTIVRDPHHRESPTRREQHNITTYLYLYHFAFTHFLENHGAHIIMNSGVHVNENTSFGLFSFSVISQCFTGFVLFLIKVPSQRMFPFSRSSTVLDLRESL